MAVPLERGRCLALGALLAAALLAFLGAADAHAQQYYKVIARHSNMCLDVANASTAHAANVLQAACWSPGVNQQWSRQATDGGYYRYRARHSGQCLDVAHVSIAHGADVIQGNCWSPGFNQQWRFVTTDGIWGTLRARHSEKCLDVAGASRAHAANVLQANCTGGDNQQWTLIALRG